MDEVLTKTLSLLDGAAVVMIAFLAGPVRLGVRLAQWTRHRLKKPPLAPFWTHRVWLEFEAIAGIAALYLLYRDTLYVLAHGFNDYFDNTIFVRWYIIAGFSVASYVIFAYYLDRFPSQPVTPLEKKE